MKLENLSGEMFYRSLSCNYLSNQIDLKLRRRIFPGYSLLMLDLQLELYQQGTSECWLVYWKFYTSSWLLLRFVRIYSFSHFIFFELLTIVFRKQGTSNTASILSNLLLIIDKTYKMVEVRLVINVFMRSTTYNAVNYD